MGLRGDKMSIELDDITTISPQELGQLSEKEKNTATKHLFALDRLQRACDYLKRVSAPIHEHENLKETILFLNEVANSSRKLVRQLIYPIKLKGEKSARKKISKKSKASGKSKAASTRRKTGSGRTKKARA